MDLNLFRKIQTQDKDLSQVQDNVIQVLNPLVKVPLLDGVLLKDVDLTTAPLRIAHRLTRQPLGWFLADNNANAVVYRSDWDSKTITLTSSAACRVSIWMF